jgi:two-component system response regulator YesN
MQTENSYYDAFYVIENYLYSGDVHVYTAESIGWGGNSALYYPLEIERQIIESAANAKRAHALGLVEKIIDLNIREGFTNKRQNELKFLLISTANRVLSRVNRDADSVFGDGAALYLEMSADSAPEFKAKALAVFEKLCAGIPGEDGAETAQLKEIVNFVDENIEKDVSLMDLAQHMKLSPWYVSRLFKNIVKYNFKAYVNMRRVEAAKRIMSEEPGIMISDLAARVGCNNTVTFNRIFKKHTGFSPGEYRADLQLRHV